MIYSSKGYISVEDNQTVLVDDYNELKDPKVLMLLSDQVL